MNSTIRDISLAPQGKARIDWVKGYMPLLSQLKREFELNKPLSGKKITVSVHLEAKTAYLCQVLAAGGAEVSVTGSNPLSTGCGSRSPCTGWAFGSCLVWSDGRGVL